MKEDIAYQYQETGYKSGAYFNENKFDPGKIQDFAGWILAKLEMEANDLM